MRKVTHLRYEEWLKRVTKLLRAIKRAGRLSDDVDIGVAARACVAVIDGIAIQVMRSGKPPSAAQQRKIIDTYIEKWLRPSD